MAMAMASRYDACSLRTRWIALLVLAGLTALASGCYRGTGGVTPQANTQLVTQRDVSAPTLEAAAREIDAGEPDKAFSRLVAWFRLPQTRIDPDRDVALLLAANALIEDGRRIKAFYYLDELLDLYPGSDLYLPAVRRQMEIARSYLAGHADRFLFLPNTRSNDALEMLFRIQMRAPGSDLAEEALLASGDHYFDRGDYDFAEDAYTVFLERFPRSPSSARARLRQAWSNLLQYEGPRYDPTPLVDARQQFQAFTARHPRLAEGQELEAVLEFIDRQLAHKEIIKADYYERTGNLPAAARLRQQVIEQYPQTPAAAESRQRLEVAEEPVDEGGDA